MSSATWSLRLRPVCSRLPASPTRAVSVCSTKVWTSSALGSISSCAAVQIVQNRVQTLVDVVDILLGDDALSAQHGGVDKAALNILLDHPRVKADGRVEIVDAAESTALLKPGPARVVRP